MLNTRMENGRVGVARSTVDMHRVRVRNRASVGATVARRAYSPAPICACVSTRQGYSAPRSYSATGDHASTSHPLESVKHLPYSAKVNGLTAPSDRHRRTEYWRTTTRRPGRADGARVAAGAGARRRSEPDGRARPPTGRMRRFKKKLRLLFLEFVVFVSFYTPENNANYLLRAPTPGRAARAAAADDAGLERAASVNFILVGGLSVTLDRLKKEKTSDRLTQLSVKNGTVMRGHKVVIPSNLRNATLDEIYSLHLGIVKIKAAARAQLWFPGVALERLAAACPMCAQLRPAPPPVPLAPCPHPPSPRETVRTYVACRSTAHPVSNNGTVFSSCEFKQFCAINGILHMFSPGYYTASNGQAESAVKNVKMDIKIDELIFICVGLVFLVESLVPDFQKQDA
ncbi:hypothetical protein EVAR_36043_1 [Eumeta japonica]|uniref:Integrase catalytic domain-containing protein n=1 Tax=Eumeta variegata TaxID=151549 RepID=A0A4C1WUF8_EUMVA|nr:hypothetical protein EVAR_36043_1 [Eumeta japonica]